MSRTRKNRRLSPPSSADVASPAAPPAAGSPSCQEAGPPPPQFSFRPLSSDTIWLGALLAIYLMSRLLMDWRGLDFNMWILGDGFQFFDAPLLKNDLLRSLWYQHSQPPLFNLFLGIVLKIAPGTGKTIFTWAFRAMGLVLTTACFGLARELGMRRILAAAITLLVVVSPAMFLYESWLFYTLPSAMLVCCIGWFSARYVRTTRVFDGVLLFACMAAVIYIRSIFHPIWFAVVLAIVLWLAPTVRRRTMACAAVPLLLVLGLFAKNWLLFGDFTSSTWGGMSLAKMAVTEIRPDELKRLRAESGYPRILDTESFMNARFYAPFVAPYKPRGVPALDDYDKTTGFELRGKWVWCANMNHFQIIEASHRFGEAARWAIAREPGAYLRSVGKALIIFLKPSGEYVFFVATPVPKGFRAYETIYSALVYGKFGEHNFRKKDGRITRDERLNDWAHVGWLLPVYLLAGFAAGAWLAWNLFRRRIAPTPATAAVLVISFTMLWVTLPSLLLEIGENNRFRYMIEPVNLVLVAALLERAWMAWRARRIIPSSP